MEPAKVLNLKQQQKYMVTDKTELSLGSKLFGQKKKVAAASCRHHHLRQPRTAAKQTTPTTR
jgi:hypothetical protein